MSLIAVEGMQFYAYHGYYEEERILGGHYLVDVYIHTSFTQAAETDDLSGTINYEEVLAITQKVMQNPVQLIEHVAWQILEKVKALSKSIEEVKVRVSKMNPPLLQEVKRTFVEVNG